MPFKLAMVARGAGVGLVPERLLHVSPYRSRVRIIDVRGFRPKLSICMVRSEALSVFDQALDAMADAVKAVLSGTQVRQRRMAQAG